MTEPQNATWRQILDSAGMAAAIERLGKSIAESCVESEVAFVGIRSRGVPIADRLAAVYRRERKAEPLSGSLDITLYRDDFGESPDWPEVKESGIPFDVAGKTIVLVDDVLYTGRTVRAALNALMDFGRPRAVRLAVLVDRGLRELPVQADYVGYKAVTRPQDHIQVRLTEIDDKDEVVVEERRSSLRGVEEKYV